MDQENQTLHSASKFKEARSESQDLKHTQKPKVPEDGTYKVTSDALKNPIKLDDSWRQFYGLDGVEEIHYLGKTSSKPLIGLVSRAYPELDEYTVKDDFGLEFKHKVQMGPERNPKESFDPISVSD